MDLFKTLTPKIIKRTPPSDPLPIACLMLAYVMEYARGLMAPHEAHGHGWKHCLAVFEHVVRALDNIAILLTDYQKLVLMIAALLHDADDKKLFKTTDYSNARACMQTSPRPDLEALVIEIISLVSCSENGNSEVPAEDRWKLFVRFADRLEAIGKIGILRTHEYSTAVGMPLFTETTPRPTTSAELWACATPERFALYTSGRKSASMMDHFFDKLLHICDMQSGSTYLDATAQARKQEMVDFVLQWGRTGTIPPIN